MELLSTPPCDPFCEGEHPIVVIQMRGFQQKVRVELDPAAAPITVAYFIQLVKQGFYNGLCFHRIVPGFLLQGGDPDGTGDGETEFYVKGEFANNGIPNNHAHTCGTLSLARQEGYDTASCQFFVLLNDLPSFDGDYAAFAQVIEGMEVFEKVADTVIDENGRPVIPIVMDKVYFERVAPDKPTWHARGSFMAQG